MLFKPKIAFLKNEPILSRHKLKPHLVHLNPFQPLLLTKPAQRVYTAMVGLRKELSLLSRW